MTTDVTLIERSWARQASLIVGRIAEEVAPWGPVPTAQPGMPARQHISGIADFSGKRLPDKFYGINCRPKLNTKLFDRFFHRRRQISPPVNDLTHCFLDSGYHLLDGDVAV